MCYMCTNCENLIFSIYNESENARCLMHYLMHISNIPAGWDVWGLD